jgi:hypothetical protein
MEAQLYDWLWARMGAYKAWQKESTEDNDGNTEYWGYANTSLYLGAGFLFKNLHIDAQVNPGFMTRGPYIVSGSGGDMFSQVTIYYVWGEK